MRSAVWDAADPPISVAVKVISKKILKGHDEIVQGEMDVLKVSRRESVQSKREEREWNRRVYGRREAERCGGEGDGD